MVNRNENKYKNDDKHELSPLLLVPIDEAKSAKKSPGSKRFVALLLVVVSATAATAAYSSSAGVNPIVSSFSSLLGTGRAKKQGEWCAGFWYAACDDGLSCFMGGNSNYCVPNGQENACCAYSFSDNEACGIDCGKDLYCDQRSDNFYMGTVSTCHPKTLQPRDNASFATKGSCNSNTGEPATNFIELKCGQWGCE